MQNIQATRVLSKSKFSMYLRTLCDRELYLSLFKKKEEGIALGIPVPLEARPGVQLITKSGREFELEQYDQLINAIPDNVIHTSRGTAATDPLQALSQAFDGCFILQPEISPESFRDVALNNIGLTQNEKDCIPPLAGLKPDVLFVHTRFPGEHEILPDGSRKPLADGDQRLGISVIDLKNVSEGNPSYSAEVCMYAFFFANWLDIAGASLKNKFYVSDQVYLWKHTEMPRFNEVLGLKAGGNIKNRISALLLDLEDGQVDYLIYMPSVRKFFKEDVPRVVRQGDQHGWASVEYHVNPRCGSCDWLGNVDWLIGENLEIYKKNPDHYCMYSAETTDHLSKIPNLSKGATQILSKGGHQKVADLAGIHFSSPVLKKHALLKRERSHIGHRATAISTGSHTFDDQNKIAGLARSFNGEHDIIINFDAGSGLLTGIALRGILFPSFGGSFNQPDGTTKSFHIFDEEAFVVNKDTENAEWVALKSFITRFADNIQISANLFSQNALGNIHTQICFWEERQYNELCNAFGRHLLKVLELPEKAQRALAWIFPADELMEKDEEISPAIVFINDIVDTTLRLPVRFANTLLGVAAVYHAENMTPRRVDRYYKEPLGNAIPRERIFEIWKSTTGTVRMYGEEVSITDAVKEYEKVLKAHSWALASITRQLRTDLRTQLQGKAPALVLSEFGGATGVAHDSKLWLQWDRINAATANTEDKATLISSVERLESSYKAIVLAKVITDFGRNRYEYEVSDDSTEAKLEEGKGYYIMGIVGIPGFPLLTPIGLGLTPQSQEDNARLRNPLYNVVNVFLEKFDRVARRATVRFYPGYKAEQTFNELISEGLISFTDRPLYLLESLSPDYSKKTEKILKEIRNPSNAKVAKESLAAMGKSAQKKITTGTDSVTPISRILWEGDVLSNAIVRNDQQANNIANFAEHTNEKPLNTSQKNAVRNCARNQLSVIWGPPGTGKTDTLTALLHALVYEAITSKTGRNILITGPNYRAVEELAGRLFENINKDTSCDIDMFWCYSSSRGAKSMPEKESHFNLHSFTMSPLNPEWTLMKSSINDPDRITVVSTTSHIIDRIVECAYGRDSKILQEIFDVIVIDESSQVEVVRALQPLAVLKNDGQLVVAGDHLQMPPISHLEPPKGAEYLVGSIQTYLIKRFKIQTQNLLVNYRSNQDLVDYAKTIGYPQELQANNPQKNLEPIKDIDEVINSLPNTLPTSAAYKELLLPDKKVAALIHEDIVSSQANEVEAKIVAGLAYCLRNSMAKELNLGTVGQSFSAFTDDEFFAYGLGVVTPHKAQKALVIKELRLLFPDANAELLYNAVDTVERFQGSQRQTILVSFGVGDTDIIEGEEEFLLQLERTNVAVSRAQAKCIILMPKSFAYHLPSEKEAAETSRAIKSYIEEFCNRRVSCDVNDNGDARAAEVRWRG